MLQRGFVKFVSTFLVIFIFKLQERFYKTLDLLKRFQNAVTFEHAPGCLCWFLKRLRRVTQRSNRKSTDSGLSSHTVIIIKPAAVPLPEGFRLEAAAAAARSISGGSSSSERALIPELQPQIKNIMWMQ